MNTRSLFASSLLFVLAGCAADSTGASPGPVPSTEAPDGSSPTPAAACPTPHGPTLHAGEIAGDETWTAEGSPHVVSRNFAVRSGRTLTIAPCATVQFEAGAGLSVAFPGTPNTGSLVAVGDAEHPIRFEGRDGAKWASIFVAAPGTARLAYVDLKDGGEAGVPALQMEGRGAMPVAAGLFVDHVTVSGASVRTARMAAFAEGSEALTVRGAPGRPLEISEHTLSTLPSGSYTGNGIDEIELARDSAVEVDTTMHARGVPYHVRESLRIGKGQGAPLATLHVEEGTTIRFAKGAALAVEHATGEFPASGALVAVGSAARPIVLTSDQAQPAPGAWRGLWFGGVPRGENRVEHVTISYAGGDCGCVLSSCSALTTSDGSVIFTQAPPAAFFDQVTIAHSKGHAFVLGYAGAAFDFAGRNTFDDVEQCNVTLPSAPSCPSPRPACQ